MSVTCLQVVIHNLELYMLSIDTVILDEEGRGGGNESKCFRSGFHPRRYLVPRKRRVEGQFVMS